MSRTKCFDVVCAKFGPNGLIYGHLCQPFWMFYLCFFQGYGFLCSLCKIWSKKVHLRPAILVSHLAKSGPKGFIYGHLGQPSCHCPCHLRPSWSAIFNLGYFIFVSFRGMKVNSWLPIQTVFSIQRLTKHSGSVGKTLRSKLEQESKLERTLHLNGRHQVRGPKFNCQKKRLKI